MKRTMRLSPYPLPTSSYGSLCSLLVGKKSSCFLCTLVTTISLLLASLLAISAVVFVSGEGNLVWVSPLWTSLEFGRDVKERAPKVGSSHGGEISTVPTVTKNNVVPSTIGLNPSMGMIELGLSRARAMIRNSLRKMNQSTMLLDPDYVPKGPIYWNANAFQRSYLEMERTLKVYVYEEGEPPLFHDGPCKNIYSTEGRFIYNLEMDTRFRTRDPHKAHVHFLPFSIGKMIKYIREPNTYDVDLIKSTIKDYIGLISQKHPYWNRSLGSDHFMISCHDWAPRSTAAVQELYNNSIRILCNANISEGFNPSKDVALPEMNLRTDATTEIIGTGPDASKRTVLGFFAGGVHGPIRPVLLKHWKGKDSDLQVYEYLPSGISYYDMMKKSKFCLCPSGFEVASPRVVEAIYLECVPVIISDNYSLPFSDVLNWSAFSIQVDVKDIANLKNILTAIPNEQYVQMQKGVKLVQRHFVVSTPPKRFDMFHMLLHSVWLRRMNVRIHAHR